MLGGPASSAGLREAASEGGGHPGGESRGPGPRSWARRAADGRQVNRSSLEYERTLRVLRAETLALALAESSSAKYRAAWQHWIVFCEDRGRPHLLDGANRGADIDVLVDFVVDQCRILGRTPGTVEGKLCAVRWYHLQAGLPDPLREAALVKMAIKGARRLAGAASHKLPVTRDMLLLIRRSLPAGARDSLVQWGGVIMGFAFMLRASEYLADAYGDFDPTKGMCFEDIEFWRMGTVLDEWGEHGQEPDEVVLNFKYSKTDQFRSGMRRNLYASGEDLCVVRALWTLVLATPRDRRTGALMRLESGKVLDRDSMNGILRAAAETLGVPGARVATHSLRIGGATAAYMAGMPIEEIKWLGRWASTAWALYVNRAHESARGISQALFQARYTLLAPAVPERATRA